MSIFEDLNKKAKQSRERWQKISELCAELKTNLSNHGERDHIIKLNSELLLLLVEQFKPLADLEGLDVNANNIIKDLFNSLAGEKDGK